MVISDRHSLKFGDKDASDELKAIAKLFNEPYYLVINVNTTVSVNDTMYYYTIVAPRTYLGGLDIGPNDDWDLNDSKWEHFWKWKYCGRDLGQNLLDNLKVLSISEISEFLQEFNFYCL